MADEPVHCGCGGEAFVSINGFIEYHVVCALCGMRTDWFRSKDKAIEAWNKAMGERNAMVWKPAKGRPAYEKRCLQLRLCAIGVAKRFRLLSDVWCQIGVGGKRLMTAEEAKNCQDKLAEHFDLGFWYGVGCERCCGVFPKLISGIGGVLDLCRYECEVCGKTTNVYEMPWLAEEAWNKGLFVTGQGRLF